MSGRVCIWGAGAIGGTIGAHLARAGTDVVLVDLVREHVDAMTRHGLSIEGPLGGFTVPVAAATPDSLEGAFDAILLAVKSQHTESAATALLPHLAPDGYVVSCQNGLNEPAIAAIVGRDRTIGAFVNFAGDYLGPGHISYGLRGTVAIGELDGMRTRRIEALRELLLPFEPHTLVSDDIFGFLWGKMAYAAVLSASALTNDTIADFIADPIRRPLVVALVQELLRIAVAEGARPRGFDTFEPAAFLADDPTAMNASLDALAAFNRDTGKTHSGIWRDLAVRKRPTEVGAQLVPIRAAAQRQGLPMTLLEALAALIGAVERGERSQGPDLADELSALAPVADGVRR
ncbi:ketopantoate reductase family protein [Methylobacterium aquaticum]|uniref:2-dehydropantoate 2-reductase n=1 Tax=Methylobacterium aquaticum TaxID=270351 RepID=A0A0J6SNS1_9HYPH|nr:2-dehydropantoate 2-reductase [Methylobacterium aquaticum]KMO36870.1 2-dehydropantoate 2-reductase [Methylobacterium aquaticum]